MIITLTTDFGLQDTFVGQMKGVILSRLPGATLVDLTHALPGQDIVAGALALESAVDAFPPGTVHLAVVDPGVGSQRAAVAIRTARAYCVGPDNGLFSLVLARDPLLEAVRLTNPRHQREPVSPTFHGRDLFAPAAAHLAGGGTLAQLGEPIAKLVTLDLPQPQPRAIDVLAIDHFGNLVTNLAAHDATPGLVIEVAGREIRGVCRTYSDVAAGQCVAYVGSGGRVEIAIRNGNAAEALGVRRGQRLTVRR